MDSRGFLALGVLLVAFVHVVRADDVRIRYAEPFELHLPSRAPIGGSKLQRDVVNYGRRFELDLQSNDQLLASVAAARRAQLPSVALYKGKLRGRNESWVRVTTIGDRVYGAIWDGVDLYAVEPREEVEPQLPRPLADRAARSLIYRLSDTEGGENRVCGLGGDPGPSRLVQYQQMVGELQSSAAALVPNTQIEVALLGDYEFHTLFFTQGESVMIARMNIVDGIFREQVGVSIVPTDFVIFDSPSDPFTATNARMLLEQLGVHRANTATIRDRGLTHLMTGRDLDGNTIGTAYLGALCERETGVSLSEARFGTLDSALIAAHEFGHNFGAPHDGEAGACFSAPPGFLMEPYLNGATTFSSCSVERMRAHASAASCLTPYLVPDASLSVPGAPLQAVLGQTFALPIDVTSVGQGRVRDLVVTAQLHPWMNPQMVAMPGADCSIAASTATCRLVELAAGEMRSMTVFTAPSFTGEFTNTVTLTASNDENATNDRITFAVNVVVAADAILSISPETISGFTRSTASADINLASTGPQALEGGTIVIDVPGTTLSSATLAGTSCSVNSSQRATCMIGSIPAGQAQTLHLEMATGVLAGRYQGTATITAANDGNPYNNQLRFPIVLQPSRELQVQITPPEARILFGDAITHTIQVASTGPQSVPVAIVRINTGAAMIEAAIPSVGSCDSDGFFMTCNLGSLASGAAATIEVRSRATAFVDGSLHVHVDPSADDTPSDNFSIAVFDVRHQVDVGLFGISGYDTYEDQVSVYSAIVASYGLSAANNVTITTSVPPGLMVRTAQLGGMDCEIVVNDITCRLGAPLEPDAYVQFDLTYVGEEPAIFGWPVTLSADGDAEALNNSMDAYIEVEPYVDATLSIDTQWSERVRIGEPQLLDVNISTNHRPLNISWLRVQGLDLFEVDSIETPYAACSLGYSYVFCPLDAIEANTSVYVRLHVRGRAPGPAAIQIRHEAISDVDWSNNRASLTTMLFREGDAAVAANTTITGIVNEWVDVPISVTATQTIDNAILEIATDYTRVAAVSAMRVDNYCSESSTVTRCFLGTVEGGSTRRFDFRYLINSVSELAMTVRLSSDNDIDPSNNEGAVLITVGARPPPPAPPPAPPTSGGGGSGGGSGGGGALSLSQILAMIGLLSVGRWRRKRMMRLCIS